MLVIQAIQEQRSGGSQLKASLGKQFARPYLKKPYSQKIGVVEWLKVKALSLSPSTAKNK
jgi:hypothetical protein